METTKKQSVLNGAMVLVISAALVKVIGAIYKIPMTDMLGSLGRGYFSTAYEVYTPIFAIAMAGLPVAVSRMVAENVALNRYREARTVCRVSMRMFLLVGTIGTLIMCAIAYPYVNIVNRVESLPALFAIAPSIFLCCFMSTYRGYYEGLRNMVPTAISQFLEALGKLVLGLIFIKVIKEIGISQFNSGMAASGNTGAVVFGKAVNDLTSANNAIDPWAATGAILGVTMGSLISTIYLMIRYKLKGDGFTREQLVNSPKPREGKAIAKEMISIAVPMVISAVILNLTNLIDSATIQTRLSHAIESEQGFSHILEMFNGPLNSAVSRNTLNLDPSLVEGGIAQVKKDIVTYLWGCYGTGLDFKSLIPTVTIQLGVSALPALAAAWAVKNTKEIRSTIETVMRVSMIIALPAGIGLGVLSEPILNIIYGGGNNADAIPVVVPIVMFYGFAAFILAISTPTTSMLQAIGRTDIPVKTVAVAVVVKIICNFIFVGNYKLNLYGALIGTAVFYIIVVGVNLGSLLKISNVKVEWSSVFFKPLVCALLCGGSAWVVNKLIALVLSNFELSERITDLVSAFAAIGFAVIIYALSLILIKGIKKDDISSLPKGEKIAKVLEKHELLG